MVWKIGDLAVDGTALLAPMSGFTSNGYRDFMRPFGVALSFTEMTSDMGVIHGGRRTAEYLDFGDEGLTGVQLFGSDPDDLSEAAKKVLEIKPNTALIDINMGCPVSKIVCNGAGSSLMKDPEKCGEIIRKIKSKINVPVTAKIRLGWCESEMNFREVIDELQSADVDMISLHVRTKKDGYAGRAHYELVHGLRKEMSVPLAISGDIYSLEDAISAVDITGAEAVMVARGGVGNPFLITQIDRYFRTGERLPNPTVSQQIGWCFGLMDELSKNMDEENVIRKMRCYAPRFVAGCHGCREYRRRLASESEDRETLTELLNHIDSEMGHLQIGDRLT